MFLIGWKKHGWLLYGFTKEKPKKIFIEREINVIFMSLYYTFTKGVAEKRFVGFENFVDLAGNTAFQLSVRNSLAFIAVGVPVIVVISLAFSIMMSDRLYRFPRWAMLSPIIVPVASALMGWSVVFGNQGLVNSILNLLGMEAVEFFGIKYVRAVMIFIFIIKLNYPLRQDSSKKTCKENNIKKTGITNICILTIIHIIYGGFRICCHSCDIYTCISF